MGRRGPPPIPTKMKVLAGNPGKRRLNKKEPKPPKNTPRCPAWLSSDAKAAWRRLVPQLERMGVLTVVDRDALVAYVQTYARWKRAEEWLDKHGEVYPLRDEQGRVRCMQQFPQVAIARNLAQLLKSYQQEFGLTPSARTRIEVNPSVPEESTADRLRRRAAERRL